MSEAERVQRDNALQLIKSDSSYLKNYVEEITQPSQGKDKYICPLCKSGTGENATGAFSIKSDGIHWKCFKCGIGGDIFDLVANFESLQPKTTALYDRVFDICRVNPATASRTPAPIIDLKTKQTPVKEKPKTDQRQYLEQAHEQLKKTPAAIEYLSNRGISEAIIDRFKLGYEPHFSGAYPQWQAIIIPTSSYSFTARNINPTAEQSDRIRKQGGAPLYITNFLYKPEPCFVVEGEIDALSILEVGGNAMALASTSGAQNFIKLCKEQPPTCHILLCLDNDEPGRAATRTIVKELNSMSLPYSIVNIVGSHKDPNAALQADREAFTKAVQDATRHTLEASQEIKTELETRSIITLAINSKGMPAKTIHNALILFTEDEPIKECLWYNQMAESFYCRVAPPWDKDSKPREWRNDDDAALEHRFERVYSYRHKDSFITAFNMLRTKKAYHPVRDWLNSLVWDGKPRIETLFIDALAALDNPYTRDVARLTIIGGIARIMEPAIKFDTMPVLIGTQGMGKSTFVRRLAYDSDWYTDSVKVLDGKEGAEGIRGFWICELGELSALKRTKDIEAIKTFLSSQVDTYRTPYNRLTEHHPRQCIFIGTTNNNDFLTDRTGSRRFYPIQCGNIKDAKLDLWSDNIGNHMAQVWAEGMQRYKQGESLLLNKDLQEEAKAMQETHLEDDPRIGMFKAYLDGDTANSSHDRKIITCVKQLWDNALSMREKQPNIPRKETNEIHEIMRQMDGWTYAGKQRLQEYGIQRVYTRKTE